MDVDFPRANDSCYEMVGKLLRRFEFMEEKSDPMYVCVVFVCFCVQSWCTGAWYSIFWPSLQVREGRICPWDCAGFPPRLTRDHAAER